MTDSEQSFDELTVGTLSSESDEDVEGEPESVSAVAKKKMLYGILHASVGLLLEVPTI